MAVETDSDRDIFLDDFGVDVVVGAVTLTGIFDNAYLETENFAGTAPRLIVKSSDVSAQGIGQGTALTVDGTSYTVGWPPQPDGTGMTELYLHEA